MALRFFITLLLGTVIAPSFAFANELDSHKRTQKQNPGPFNVMLGVSHLDRILVLEYRHTHHALAVGYPGNISYKYFLNKQGDSPLIGTFYGAFDNEKENDVVDGVEYRDMFLRSTGLSLGYRWYYDDFINLTLTVSGVYEEEKHTNPGSNESARQYESYWFPGVSFGLAF